MKVTSARTVLITALWDRDPFWLEDFRRTAALIEITTDEGVTGLGETIAGYFCPEAVPPLVDLFAEGLIGLELDPLQPRATTRELRQQTLWWGRVGLAVAVLSGIEIALWDIAGKALGQPVWKLLGGREHDTLPLYASCGAAAWPLERTVEQAQHCVDLGFETVKISTGRAYPDGRWFAATEAARPDEERAKFSALRSHLGSEVDLAVDGHAVEIREPWSRRTSEAIARTLEEFDLLFYEEPLPYDDVHGYSLLRRATRTPIAGGECLTGVAEFARFLDADALDYVQPDATHVGGIQTTVDVARLAAGRGVGLIVHTGAAAGPGFMANVHAAFASENARLIECATASASLRDAFLLEPLEMVNGSIAAPTAPGLGVELRQEAIDRWPYRPGVREYA